MGVIEIVLMGVGLAMDAFAVAVCKGLAMRKVNMRQCFLIALFFGGFQGLMPLLGWLLGRQFADSISALDHWVAFVLLGYIGGKMIYDAIKERDETVEIEQMDPPLEMKELVMLSIATSIDALAVGISFAVIHVNIFTACLLICGITFGLSLIGAAMGQRFGSMVKEKARVLGGVILILIRAADLCGTHVF